MTDQLTLIIGHRQTGRTESILLLMADTAVERNGRGLLIVPNQAAAEHVLAMAMRLEVDERILIRGWASVRDELVGQTFAVVGVDGVLPGGPVKIPGPVEFQTVMTTTDMAVIQASAVQHRPTVGEAR